MSARVTVHEKGTATTVLDYNQLDAVLRAASEEARSKNILGAIIIESENGNSITMVVGGDETVLGFDYGHGNHPYYASKGASERNEPFLTCYLSFQHHTEFPRKNVIPYNDGAKAVAQFVDSGNLPTCISWEEV